MKAIWQYYGNDQDYNQLQQMEYVCVPVKPDILYRHKFNILKLFSFDNGRWTLEDE